MDTTWSIQSGGYLGEISALCFVHLPPHISSLPYLLVGSGSQILVYELELGKSLNSFDVFEGIRVHGVLCSSFDETTDGIFSTLTSSVVVFGEKRVKVFSLSFRIPSGNQNQLKVCAELLLTDLLPRFSHWIMDVLFLKETYISSKSEGNNYLAVGLGDNSICLWDLVKSSMVFKIRCPERTLLYSMRLWGKDINSFQVASGTIYNEVIVWKLVSRKHNSSFRSSSMNSNRFSSSPSDENQLLDLQYEAMYLNRLAGHEGSIFRLAWSPDGSKLVSVSDDRSARLWNINTTMKDSASARIDDELNSVGIILFGHTARVWDCYISDLFIVTAGEDCTCRMWGMDGKQLFLIKEHSGRGIWRCAYDPCSSVLITAGFDSSVKVHMLQTSIRKGTTKQIGVVAERLKERMEVFALSVPNVSDQLELMNSKSEYVRCLRFAREDTLYVATNNGYLYHVKLSDAINIKWTEVVRVSEDVPIVCMDLLCKEVSDTCTLVEDWIAVGDGRGNSTIVKIVPGVCSPIAGLFLTWSAGMERQLLGTYWCKSLGPSFVFTADPRGILKLWRIDGPLQSGSELTKGNFCASLTAEFTSCFGTRIMCLDASFDEQVLVCGDQRGNLIIFSLSRGLLTTHMASKMKYSPVNSFKGAHGISSVTSISISIMIFNQIEIRSTGGDGCVCSFKYSGDWRSLEFTGMKQVKELSLIQSVSSDANCDEDLACGSYAVGFASADFIIWSLLNEIKVVQIICGGWRRPHSYYLGDAPENQNCFAFVKDHAIHIHRLWVPDSERNLIPRVLHMQFHGREIHSLCFVSKIFQSDSDEDTNGFSFVATGCEDGTVRLTRYSHDRQSWLESKLLGEHVGGSAVRSICFVSKIYKIAVGTGNIPNGQNGCNLASHETSSSHLLISVGAKRVLTSWLLQIRRLSNKRGAHDGGDYMETENKVGHSQGISTSLSFQWLSTDMPLRFASTHRTIEETESHEGLGGNVSNVKTYPTSEKLGPGNNGQELKAFQKKENDWRYLAVTSFLVKCANCRSTVCFIVVSCSDATLTLRALVLPYRLWCVCEPSFGTILKSEAQQVMSPQSILTAASWATFPSCRFDVALLVPQTTPVLSLQNIVLETCEDDIQVGCVYILISGSTDGSITFWNLTSSIEGFMQWLSEIRPENFIDCQKRPRTGRGSQGGRWWRTLPKQFSKPDPEDITSTNRIEHKMNDDKTKHIAEGSSYNITRDLTTSEATFPQTTNTASCPDSEDHWHIENCEIRPFHVLNNAHQSGVNCLHASTVSGCGSPESAAYCILSGGDDQALHCLTFELLLQKTDNASKHENCSDNINCITEFKISLNNVKQLCCMRFLSHDRIASAHSSAINGVWTDGSWAFTTGLDQRVRCWHISKQGNLSEHAHMVISVTEPETLDARACGRNQYQIAVAGRGMQIFKFSASHDKAGCD